MDQFVRCTRTRLMTTDNVTQRARDADSTNT